MKGRGSNQKLDWIDKFDPRVTGLAAPKGTLFRFVPTTGFPTLLIKGDDGFSQDWQAFGEGDQPFVYFVTPGTGNFPTIQSAIDQAFADGSGLQVATIYVPPGTYNENLTFRPGQAIIGQNANVSVGAIRIVGQHTYTPPVGSDPLAAQVCLQGMSFIDLADGHTMEILGAQPYFFTVSGCSFTKGDFTGNCIRCLNASGILVLAQSSTTYHGSPDPVVRSSSQVMVIQQMSHASGGVGPMLDYDGGSSVQFFNNSQLNNAPYVVNMQNGTMFCQGAFVGSFGTDPDGFRLGAGAVAYVTNSTFIVNAGTGYVFQGTGTVNGAMIVYGINSNKDPGLTFNLLASDPS